MNLLQDVCNVTCQKFSHCTIFDKMLEQHKLDGVQMVILPSPPFSVVGKIKSMCVCVCVCVCSLCHLALEIIGERGRVFQRLLTMIVVVLWHVHEKRK